MQTDTFWDQLDRRISECWSWLVKTGAVVADASDPADLVVRLGGRAKSLYNYAFENKNIVILGPKGCGKTSLIGFLRSGHAVVSTHEPTVGLALVDRNFELGDAEWLSVAKDVGGDEVFRSLWPQLTKTVNPDAMIYLLDGRKNREQIKDDMETCLSQSLSQYTGGRLRLIYIFVNFYDGWNGDSWKNDCLIPFVQSIAAERKHTYPALRNLKLKAEPTHISPHLRAWPELETALQHFSTDIKSIG